MGSDEAALLRKVREALNWAECIAGPQGRNVAARRLFEAVTDKTMLRSLSGRVFAVERRLGLRSKPRTATKPHLEVIRGGRAD